MPIIVKRAIHTNSSVQPIPPINTGVNFSPKVNVKSNIPSINKSELTQTTSVSPYCETYDVPVYYNSFLPVFNLLWVIIVLIIITLGIIILLNILFGSIIGFILLLLPKSQKCKKCGKIFRYKKEYNNRCPYCNSLISDEIIPH